MATVNEKMGALANEIRELSGTTSIKTIDNMANDVAQANEEILDQAELINQIYTALENKAGSSGVQLPTLNNPASASDILSGKEAIDGSGNKITGTIATKTSSNLTASGATVTVPAGYYASNATKSVATATQATPTVSINSSGKITASATQTAGYVSAGTKTGTKQLTTQGSKTITPTTTSQTAVASGVYTTGAVTVAAIPNNYEDVGTETNEYTSLVDELEGVIDSLPESGGCGGEIELGIAAYVEGAYMEPLLYAYPIYFIKGWTWNDYINSKFNCIEVTRSKPTDEFSFSTNLFLINNKIISYSDIVICSDKYGETEVLPTDLIEDGKIYSGYWDD